MKERGTVKKLKRDLAYVELTKNERCEGCKLCVFGKKQTLTVPALLKAEVKAGDEVSVLMPQNSGGIMPLMIYALPLLGILVGALSGLSGEWWLQLTLASAGLIIGIIAVFPIERIYRRKPGVLPVVTGIWDGNTENTKEIGE